MFLWFENHSVFTLKPSVIANLSGAQSTKRNAALIGAKNKSDGESTSANAQGSSATIAQSNSQRDSVQIATNGSSTTGANSAKPDSLRTRT